MPHRRPVKKGSFAGHFNDLVHHFPAGGEDSKRAKNGQHVQRKRDHRHINDRLSEQAHHSGSR